MGERAGVVRAISQRQGNDVNQFRQAGTQVILHPPELQSGKLVYPYAEAKR
jgi:hypothetical protein